MEYSLLCPAGIEPEYKMMSSLTFHDLGMDTICAKVGRTGPEKELITRTMCALTSNPAVTKYRCDIFEDLYNNPNLCDILLKLLDKVNFIRDYGMRHTFETKSGMWDLMHRLDEVNDYIACVENIYNCLSKYPIRSEGLIGLRDYVDKTFHEDGYAELKKDIAEINAKSSEIRSVTLGVNLNQRFEAESIGVVSINKYPFFKAGIISNFADMLIGKDELNESNEWDGDYRYRVMSQSDTTSGGFTVDKLAMLRASIVNPVMAVGLAHVPNNDITSDVTRYMDKIVNHMLNLTVTQLREVLTRHLSISIRDITGLIPELVYYVRWTSYIRASRSRGLKFCKPSVIQNSEEKMWSNATAIYNIKLADSQTCEPKDIIANNFIFDDERRAFILTGANRGGKTTFTQAIGQLYVLAQGGIYIPGQNFRFTPVDCIYTHFPADEDKTMDLGRLGEECDRFRKLFKQCTQKSLLLLNETFSTTSFEEGYYIALDAMRAILDRKITTVFNTHMHKLAYDIDTINNTSTSGNKALSMVVESVDGECTYRVKASAPQGMSFAEVIAKRYGVTYDALLSNDEEETLEEGAEQK